MRTLNRAGWVVAGVLLSVSSVAAAERGPTLVEAVQKGDVSAVRRLLQQQGGDVNAPSRDGSTALHFAVHRNDAPTVEELLRAGANVNVKNRRGVAPLLLAAENGHTAIIERLLTAGAEPDAAWPGGETAIMTAARTGNAAAVTALMAKGADVNHRETTRGQTALMWAAAEGHAEVIRTLVAHGADLSARANGPRLDQPPVDARANRTGGIILGSGAFSKRLDALTPLLFAVRRGQMGAVQALLELGAPVNDATPQGWNALLLAITNAHYELGAMLLAKGADPNLSADGGWSPLHELVATSNRATYQSGVPLAVPTGTMTAVQLAERLIARGAVVSAVATKSSEGVPTGAGRGTVLTPLFIGAENLNIPMLRLLVASGADTRIAAPDGTTQLMVAAGVNDIGQPDDVDPGPRLEAAKLLLEQGNDVNAVNGRGDTALHGAARRGAKELAQLLIEHGARLDIKSKIGVTPLAIAEGKECQYGCKDGLMGLVQPAVAAVLRQAMNARGVPIEDIKPAVMGLSSAGAGQLPPDAADAPDAPKKPNTTKEP